MSCVSLKQVVDRMFSSVLECSAPILCTLSDSKFYYNPYTKKCTRWPLPLAKPRYPEFIDACYHEMGLTEYLKGVANNKFASMATGLTAAKAKRLLKSVQ
eukprot:Protomagalhaensia_sp_Gyna_25__4415@NODE_402_length_3561_cov_15_132311_g308_i0_p3_GENE_NODE_402_length_3561_cov_15_132311_g308_i0NODE_402_length_3561_cov_15_132311_g308_i0_p3_ORF_typecomplete_len100_score10_70Kunitz_BPTI/PF00014_23/0_7_NODE_402_length_3561_cov_15_132311_g308_i0323622